MTSTALSNVAMRNDKEQDTLIVEIRAEMMETEPSIVWQIEQKTSDMQNTQG
jgi:hypothetical protein